MKTCFVQRLVNIEFTLVMRQTRARFGYETCCKLADRVEAKLNARLGNYTPGLKY